MLNNLLIAPYNNHMDKLKRIHFWAYGVGHFINDLVVACWFNFLLYFLKRVAETPVASYVLLIGQVTDGLTTPLVGFFSDKCETRFGKRIPWYFAGTLLVTISFMPLFVVMKSTQQGEFVYYVGFGIIFSIGWAFVQISHMSLVPSLTPDRQRRDRLNNLRNFFTFAANLIVLGFGLIVFTTVDSKPIGFFLIAVFALALGVAASIFFLCVIIEKQLTVSALASENAPSEGDSLVEQKSWEQGHSNWKWFRMPSFYLFGICYTGVRIYTNIFGTLLPFYLVGVLKLGSHEQAGISFNIALIPLICYFTSVIAAGRLSWFYSNVGRKKALLVGTLICVLSMATVYILTVDYAWVIYYLAVFIGISQAMVLGTGINLISEVVGEKGSKGAFVFGVYSFFDKIIVGVIIYLVSNTTSYTKTGTLLKEDVDFIRLTLTLISGGGCLIGALIVLLYPIPEYRNKETVPVDSTESNLDKLTA